MPQPLVIASLTLASGACTVLGGDIFAGSTSSAVLLSALIGLQNIPEGFNAFCELRSHGAHGTVKILSVMFGLAFLGTVAG